MRKLLLSMQTSLDGFVEGPNGAMDWFSTDEPEQWSDRFALLETVDTVLLGRAMFPGYSAYWEQALTSPQASTNHRAYAERAVKTKHVVVSRTVQKINWHDTSLVSDLDAVSAMKQGPGKSIVALGGVTLASALTSAGLVDEYLLLVNPVVLGSGLGMFKSVDHRQRLALTGTRTFPSGVVMLRYQNAR
jgi:dihydrofolate reductase